MKGKTQMNNGELTFLQKVEEKVNEQRKEREKLKINARQ